MTRSTLPYADPSDPALPPTGFQLDRTKAALVVVDPQNDFLSPSGVSWPYFGESIVENGTVDHLETLFRTAKQAGIPVAVSPHYYYPCDHGWQFGGPLEKTMHALGMFERKGPVTLEGYEGSGADFLERYKPYILDGETIIASPHKVYGPETNDLALQLRKRGVSQVILAGMAANLCIESHLRELVEQGFEVLVVRDATAGPRVPEGDGYLAALVNFRFIAHALWSTAQTVEALQATA
ncbi:cysteine hydrolase family protein [Burkholderia gladioli]|uniref:cysteine hydrolase family protein n=1 Tax=Burkholderia gladioli TaxID=28095 RepID=UPI000CDB0D15|nr:isochorismatase family cysteine hydrolase [Burkholderia gladioli]MBU9267550.1 cysteine hydrolase [Burkholderia gladioli]MBU9273766.1 cysteine hydrolase [Burkholderia gladioli]MDN7495594.1 isochorismatase family cysteine hydrolase [Burkholderia gladioli]MDN7598613.1 isochorismatase family cysteine hydrolase [Burkholderia gladioli]MDN7812495.1 isochorismatase family cysteine hydrolase [Burkholderia gladioli]